MQLPEGHQVRPESLAPFKPSYASSKTKTMPYEIGFPRILTSGAFLNHKSKRQTSHELQKNLDSRCVHFVHPVEKDS